MRPHGSLAISMLALGVTALGCTPTPTTTADLGADAPGSVSLSAASYCEEIVDFFCEFYLRCGRMAVPSTTDCRGVFLETCNARYEPRYVALADAALLSLSSTGVTGCATHLSAVACEEQSLELQGPCAAMWVGAQPAGGTCAIDVESFVCAPGTTCAVNLSLCGTCETTAALGAACAGGASCGPEGICDGANCQARPKIGEACDGDRPCVLPARCVGSICTAPSYVGEGDSCDAEHRCPYLTACIGGSCRRQALLGEACASDRPCASGRCVASLCVELLADGAACKSPLDCRSGSCRAGSCAALPGPCL